MQSTMNHVNAAATPLAAEASPTQEVARHGPRSELGKTLWGFQREFVALGVFSMVVNVLMLVPTLYMLQVYDRVMVSRSELTLLVVSLMVLFLYAVMAVADWSRSRLLVRLGVRLDRLLGPRVFNASFAARFSAATTGPADAEAKAKSTTTTTTTTTTTSQDQTQALSDLAALRRFLTGPGIFAFFDAPWVPIYVAVLFVLHPLLGVTALLFAALQTGLAWWGHQVCVAPTRLADLAKGEASAFLRGKLRNAEVIEAMGMLGNLRQRWVTRHEHALAADAKAQALSSRLAGVSKFLRYSQQSLLLGAGALLVIDGQLTPGAMIAASVLGMRALAPIDALVGSWPAFINARASFARLNALLRAHPDHGHVNESAPWSGLVEFRNVTALAQGRQEPVLKGISFTARPGCITLVSGPSGSGKSTLARVMVGVWPSVDGEVLLDGQPMAAWDASADQQALGPQVGYLPQDCELFEGSIAQNIARFGDVDSAQVIAAARSAGLHELILRLPQGYDTPIGEAGQWLSGGQRQRIGLARALYGDPALIVLDEPNANLDDAGDAALLRAVLDCKARGKTMVVITHRPGLVGVADAVLSLKDGLLMSVTGGPSAPVAASPSRSPSTSPPPAAPDAGPVIVFPGSPRLT